MTTFPPRCYYYNENDFGSVDGYERHVTMYVVITRHPNLPGRLGPADIELYNLKRQGMSWEREINRI